MAVPNDIHIAQQLEAKGYFTKAAAGDQKAASLFVRLFAYTANPEGKPFGWGWLKKGGGHQVDGYSEDAVVYGNNPADLHNVVDMVIGTGAPGARLVPNTTATVPRRASDTWEAPRPLTASELAYLGGTGTVPGPSPAPTPKPCPDPSAHLPKPKPAYPGDGKGAELGAALFSDYAAAGQTPNPGMGIWFFRTAWDAANEGLTMDQSIAKHRAEWRALLGLPPL